ncbi:SPOR domain-containing protein [Litorilituus lipolyticus]|uniref:DedD protein n=1 Tax=Litorilituus lipolyticus TaxID=2491017 RepID=A0A502LHG3_9GAMM|nr:SPOR domain-containing protein [Litorilituus lipolyticus]TPH19197.1 dedD protein [Litorilituus lipolyticus]
MSTPFQNRLVGTVIVAAIVIIFLPDLLDGEKNSNKAHFQKIPETPVFTGKLSNKKFPTDKLIEKKDKPISNEQAIDVLATVDNSDSTAQQSAQKTVSEDTDEINANKVKTAKVEEKPKAKQPNHTAAKKVKEQSLPERAVAKQAWVIHLGSFKHKQNVAQLLKKLKDNGYTAFTRPIKTKQGTLTKVFIGPELIKSSLENKLPALKKLTNTQGKVALFEPIS